MIVELIFLAIVLMIIFGVLKWMMKIGMKIFYYGIVIIIILFLLGLII